MKNRYNLLITDMHGKEYLTEHVNFNLAQRAAMACYEPTHTIMFIINNETGIVERDVLNWWEGKETEECF